MKHDIPARKISDKEINRPLGRIYELALKLYERLRESAAEQNGCTLPPAKDHGGTS